MDVILLLVQQDECLFQLITEATYRQQQEDVEEIGPVFLIHAAIIRVKEVEEPGGEHITVGKFFREQLSCWFWWNVYPLLTTLWSLWFGLEPGMALTEKVTGLKTWKVWPGDVGVDLF